MQTASDLIDGLGGTAEVSRIAGVKMPAVSNWRRLGLIPPRHYLRLAQAARDIGIAVPDHLFRETSDAERGAAA